MFISDKRSIIILLDVTNLIFIKITKIIIIMKYLIFLILTMYSTFVTLRLLLQGVILEDIPVILSGVIMLIITIIFISVLKSDLFLKSKFKMLKMLKRVLGI